MSAPSRKAAAVVRAELEVCVDSEQGLIVCEGAGVDRIELCTALAVGGLTPSQGFMARAAHADTQPTGNDSDSSSPAVYALIRARAGDFCFTETEVGIMCADIQLARQVGLAGVVLGAATADGRLDDAALRRMCKVAGPLGKTLHRVIDLLADPLQAIDQAVDLGFDRILTSGGARQVGEGLSRLKQMQDHAAGRIQIMAGAGLSPSLAGSIRSHTGIQSFHSSCTQTSRTSDASETLGFTPGTQVDASLIRDYQRVLASH